MNTKNQELNLKPILKWVGGKRQLLNVINNLHPKKFDTYCEPFLGGGAVLFSNQPNKPSSMTLIVILLLFMK